MAAFTVPYNEETNAPIVQVVYLRMESYETWGLIDTGSAKHRYHKPWLIDFN